MLSFFHIKNFRSIPDVTIDLKNNHSDINQRAFIYGENGSGKSNIISAMYFLLRTFRTIKDEDAVRELPSRVQGFYPELPSEELKYRMQSSMQSLDELLRSAKRLGSSEPIELEIGFRIDDHDGRYRVLFDTDSVVAESLSYQIGNRSGIIFSITEDDWFLSPTIFADKNYREELYDNMQRYFGSHTFLSILMGERHRINKGIFENMVNQNLIRVMDELWNISIYSSDGQIAPRCIMSQNISFGYVDRLGNNGLDAIERILNSYYSNLFRDIKRVYYRRSLIGQRMCYELVFVRELAGQLVEVPYSMESTGIKKLTDILPYMLSAIMGGVSIVDECGSGIHDVALLELMKNMLSSLQGQFITTIHNTQLMKDLPQENVYIIRVDEHGNKSVSSIKNYSFRTQRTNSIQNKYLAGDYEGIPMIGNLNLENLADEVSKALIEYSEE